MGEANRERTAGSADCLGRVSERTGGQCLRRQALERQSRLRNAGDVRGFEQPLCKPIRSLSAESRESGDESGCRLAVSDYALRHRAKPESAAAGETDARNSEIPVETGADKTDQDEAAPVNKQGRVFWTRPLKLPD